MAPSGYTCNLPSLAPLKISPLEFQISTQPDRCIHICINASHTCIHTATPVTSTKWWMLMIFLNQGWWSVILRLNFHMTMFHFIASPQCNFTPGVSEENSRRRCSQWRHGGSRSTFTLVTESWATGDLTVGTPEGVGCFKGVADTDDSLVTLPGWTMGEKKQWVKWLLGKAKYSRYPYQRSIHLREDAQLCSQWRFQTPNSDFRFYLIQYCQTLEPQNCKISFDIGGCGCRYFNSSTQSRKTTRTEAWLGNKSRGQQLCMVGSHTGTCPFRGWDRNSHDFASSGLWLKRPQCCRYGTLFFLSDSPSDWM